MLSIDAWLDEKPYKELYDGVIHEKVSPLTGHGIVAGSAHSLLAAWGRPFGFVMVELRVYLDKGITLVPDVAFVSNERLAGLSRSERVGGLPFAPDIAVEVRSPSDRGANIRRKTGLYLTYGAKMVLNIDPATRSVLVTTNEGERTLGVDDMLEEPGFAGLSVPVTEFFAALDRLERL